MARNEFIVSILESLRNSSDYDFSSICLVPRGLKQWNEDAYMPRVVSIGPRFKGSTEDLLLMEEVKLSCMMSLLHRVHPTDVGQMGEPRVMNSWMSVWELAEEDNKVEEVKKPELAKIMFVDGCFVLELLISKSKELYSHFSSHRRGRPAAEMINNDNVLSDLMLLENQIPIFVLYNLFLALFGRLVGPDRVERTIINNLVLSLLGYSIHQLPPYDEYHRPQHILDLVHFYVNRRSTPSQQQEDHVVIDIMDTTQTQLKLKRCALRLLTAGVTIKVKLPEDIDSNEDKSKTRSCLSLCGVKGKHMDNIPGAKGLEFYFKFENRKLEIEQLNITNTTKAKWCNLIAWEHHLKSQGIKKNEGRRSSSLRGNGISTSAALIFNSLICSEDDVQFLKDKKIVVDHTKMSNQNLIEFFRKIASGVDHTVVDSGSYYTQIFDHINNFSKAFFIKRIWIMVWNSFTYHQEWLLKFLNHNYNFIATVISLCTVVQTIYAIIAYQLPKN